MKHVKITSFGYGHGPAPEADITLDIRRALRRPPMRHLTAVDKTVRGYVMAQPVAVRLVADVASSAQSLLTVQSTVSVAIGDEAGSHRAPALVMSLEAFLAIVAEDLPAEVTHRDLYVPQG